jgi:hypothetical protein
MKTDTGNYYFYIYSKTFSADITGAVLELENVPFGKYKITWYDPVNGTISDSDTLLLANTYIDFKLPEFSEEVAVKLQIVEDYVHPVAIAGKDQILPLGASVTIDGSGSTNPKGLPIIHSWQLVAKPEASSLNIADPSAVSFSLIPDEPGEYLFVLNVSDTEESSLPDTLMIFVAAHPVASAGSDISVTVGSEVTLNGSSSYDPSGYKITYKWTLISKPESSNALLKNINYVNPILTPDVAGVYTVVLVVNNGLSNSDPDTVYVNSASITGLDNPERRNLLVYPNPVQDVLRVQGSKTADITIMNMEGRIVRIARNVSSISVSDLANGLYSVTVREGNSVCNQKVLIAR